MADLAAQREARRRKITQNAELRMNRLLGIVDSKTSDTKQSGDSPEATSDPSTKLLNNEQTYAGTDDDLLREPSRTPYNLRQRPTRNSSSPPDPSEDVTSNNNSSSDVPDPVSAPRPSLREVRQELRSSPGQRGGEATPLQGNQDDARTYEIVHIAGCILAAVIARYVLKFGVGLFYFETILLPFIAMELGLSYLSRTHLKYLSRPPPPGTMWSAALMLCGIKQELINHYNSIMSHVSAATSDFFLFLFSFLVFNAFVG